MIKIAIVDDEPNMLSEIKHSVSKQFKERNIDTTITAYSDGKQLITAIDRGALFDVVFLDIELPDKPGLEIARSLRETNQNVMIAFVTSFDNYVYDAFDYDVIGYIRKHELDARLGAVIDRIIKKYKEVSNEKLFKNASGQYRVIVQNIAYFESNDHNIMIHLNDGTEFTVTGSLKKIEEEYSIHGFFRIHSGYLVNLAYVFSIEKNEVMVKCETNMVTLPVSRGRSKELKTAYQHYIRGIR